MNAERIGRPPPLEPPQDLNIAVRNWLRRAWRVLSRNPLTLMGAAVLLLALFVAIFAPALAPHDFIDVQVAKKLQPPGRVHWLGTDQFGRDILSRAIMGSRVSLLVGVAATGLAATVGLMIGSLAGWFGGRLDDVLMRLMDVILAFPAIILAIALAAILGPGLDKVILIVAFNRVPQYARIIRGAILAARGQDYVEAARALGQHPFKILGKHLLPNCLAPIVVFASFSLATAINTEASLSFLGLGIQPPAASWGSMLSDARQYMLLSPWMAVVPGAAITLTVLGANLLGDGIRDLMDPRSQGERIQRRVEP